MKAQFRLIPTLLFAQPTYVVPDVFEQFSHTTSVHRLYENNSAKLFTYSQARGSLIGSEFSRDWASALRFARLCVARDLRWCHHDYRSRGRFWVPHPPRQGFFLCMLLNVRK